MQPSSNLTLLARVTLALALAVSLLGAAGLAADEAAKPEAAEPAAAATVAESVPGGPAGACSAAPGPSAAAPAWQAALGGPIAPANCVADCTQNPDVGCWGSSCVSVDQSCQNGIRGFVQCDGGPVLYCNVCPECPEECPQGISCSNDDDCCATTYGEGFCVNGTCQCDF